MNEVIAFLSEKNVSYLTGLSIEQILKGNLREAQELLKAEEKRLEKLPKPAPVIEPIEPKSGERIPFSELTETHHVCETCSRKEGAPFDYRITSSRLGKCDSCGSEKPLQSIMRFNEDMKKNEPEEKETPIPFALSGSL
jgi:hypothetical protein